MEQTLCCLRRAELNEPDDTRTTGAGKGALPLVWFDTTILERPCDSHVPGKWQTEGRVEGRGELRRVVRRHVRVDADQWACLARTN